MTVCLEMWRERRGSHNAAFKILFGGTAAEISPKFWIRARAASALAVHISDGIFILNYL